MNDTRLDEPQNESLDETQSLDRVKLDRLNTRFDQMEQRLAALERRINTLERAAGAVGLPVSPNAGTAASPLLPAVPVLQAGGIFPVFGRALLGIAGAYLLRAIAAAHLLPETIMEFAAIAYALCWLALGARARTTFAAVTYACTSVLILALMLWELIMSFRTLPAWAGAAALATFVMVGFAFARDEQHAPILRIANLSAAALCLALGVVTHHTLPFLLVLLFIAGACEYLSLRSNLRCGRMLVALAADIAVWLLILIYRAPAVTRADYPSLSAFSLIAPGFVLFAIHSSGITIRKVMHAGRISIFDEIQVTTAFLLAACGLLYFGPLSSQIILGCLCLVLAAALYAANLAFPLSDRRDQIVFNMWSAALLLSCIWFAVPAAARSTTLGLAAIAATAAGTAWRQASLAWHGVLFLVVSASISGLPAYTFHALTGTAAAAPSMSVCAAALVAALCYATTRAQPRHAEQSRIFPFLFAAIAALAAAAMLVQESTRLAAAFFEPGPHHLALLRSLILCAAALALAFSGACWRRPELTQIGYGVVALEAIKLLVEDLRHGHLAYVTASVCLFAFTLIAIPRVSRRSPNRSSAA